MCNCLPICVKMKMMDNNITKYPLFMIYPQVNEFALMLVGEKKRKKLSQFKIISHWWEVKESALTKLFEGCLEEFLTENQRKKFYNLFCSLVKEDGDFRFLTGDLGIVGISSIRMLFLYSDIKDKKMD